MSLTAAFATVLAVAAVAGAQQENERTVLKFSAPVMVPGATLPAGTYVFRLADSDVDRHTVHILTEDESKVVATTMAVPARRQEAKGDTVLKFNPTASGVPALKAWFYPGTVYGHEFVYPDAEARAIAERTKTVVLSRDVEGSDRERATLHVYDAAGNRSEWKGDAGLNAEWKQWHEQARGSARMAAPAGTQPASRAPMYAAGTQGLEIGVDDLEDDGDKYIGKVVSVDAEVEKVLGPRIFTIDEPNWSDLEGEVLVYMSTDLAAMVREGDRVTVTGTPKAYVRDDIEDEWGWLDLNAKADAELAERPVLVADRIVGGTSDLALVIRTSGPGRAPEPVGTSGTTGAAAPITDVGRIAAGKGDLVGSRVRLSDVPVEKLAKDHGFWIRGGSGNYVFVLPSRADAAVAPGQRIDVTGVVLQMPKTMKTELAPAGDWNTDVYVYATQAGR